MNNKKENMMVVRFRAADEEKQAIEKAAKEYAISVNQYVKYKVLTALEDEYFHKSSANNRQSSPKHWRLLSRIIIYSYLHIQRLAENQLSDDELQQINAEAIERLEKLGLRETQ